jgi:peptidyl-dipeptidase Dcp
MTIMNDKNPLLQPWNTPFGVPPFGEIDVRHFLPAITTAISSARAEVDAIAQNSEPPTFGNTIEALENAGTLLGRITSVLFNLNSAETSPDLQNAAMEASPLLTEYSSDLTLNEKLFLRIADIYRNRDYMVYSQEQRMVLEKTYLDFLKGGAGLEGHKREQYREITSELATLSLKFEENVLAETNDFTLHLTDKSQLAGLPEGVCEAAASEAKARDLNGWVFTLHAPSFMPFMQYSEKRGLREKMLKAYSSRAFRNNGYDNRTIVKRTATLRLELARLLGYDDFASLALEDRMAETPAKVMKFLNRLLNAALPAANSDFRKIEDFAQEEGFTGDLERWDWAYYSEKLKKRSLDIDDELLKPYFRLEQVQQAVFDLATKLYGISFHRAADVPVYHPGVTAFEVMDGNRHLALLYLDFHPRKGKSGGAWMTSYRDQSVKSGKDIRPVVSLVMNFTSPTDSRPSLLTHNEVTTLLHEFGHALHAMLSECTYESLSGTNVVRDFVELPSQIMENWAYEKEWLDLWAEHYKTGEKIPTALLDKLRELALFNGGYACLRQVSFGLLDMAWHTLKGDTGIDIAAFERNAMCVTDLFPPVDGTNMSVSFGHLFSGGYAAAYYGYKWAEVLDADAFSMFRENGIFDKQTAEAFRKNILEKGGSEKPGVLFSKFRGREPAIEPLLKRSGFIG